MEDYVQNLSLADNEGNVYQVNQKIRNYSQLINDFYLNDPDDQITIPYQSQYVKFVIQYFEIHNFQPKFTQKRPVTTNNLLENLGNQEDFDLMQNIQFESISKYLDIAKFLNIPILQDLFLTVIATHLLNPLKSINLFENYSKISTEEEEQLLKQFPWAENDLKLMKKENIVYEDKNI